MQIDHTEVTGVKEANVLEDDERASITQRVESFVEVPAVLLVVPVTLVTVAQAVMMVDVRVGNVLNFVATIN